MNFKGFYFITDPVLTKKGVSGDVEDAIRGGATIVQYRAKEKETGLMVKEAEKLKKICEGKATFLVNDRIDVCLAVGADGVHLGQSDMEYQIARRLLGDKIIGVTVHNLEEAKAAESAGADYLGVSPVFHTDTKKDAGPGAGLRLVKEVRNNCSSPIVAIGGIKLENAQDVLDAGADTICALSATIGDNTEEKIREFTNLIRGHFS